MKIQQLTNYPTLYTKHQNERKHRTKQLSFSGINIKQGGISNKNAISPFLKLASLTTAAAITTKELLFNHVFGVKTRNQTLEDTDKFGEEIAKLTYETGKFPDTKAIKKIIDKHIGEKYTDSFIIAPDRESFIKQAMEGLLISRKDAETTFDLSASAVVPNIQRKGKILLSLRVDEKENNVAVNIATHELEHLMETTTLMPKIGKTFLKFIKKEKVEQKAKEILPKMNSQASITQDRLITNLIGVKGGELFEYSNYPATREGLIEFSPIIRDEHHMIKILTRIVRRTMLQPVKDSTNVTYLIGYEKLFRDEARAYRAGSKAQKHYENLIGQNNNDKTNNCEMIAILYEELADVIYCHRAFLGENLFLKAKGKAPIEYYEPISIKNEDSKITDEEINRVKEYLEEIRAHKHINEQQS